MVFYGEGLFFREVKDFLGNKEINSLICRYVLIIKEIRNDLNFWKRVVLDFVFKER